MRLVFLARRSGLWRYEDEANGWMGDEVSEPKLFAVVTVESAREVFACVVPSRPVRR